MRDTLGLISRLVAIAGSLEEAKRLVDEEVAKGDCDRTIPKRPRDEEIERLWGQKVKAGGRIDGRKV